MKRHEKQKLFFTRRYHRSNHDIKKQSATGGGHVNIQQQMVHARRSWRAPSHMLYANSSHAEVIRRRFESALKQTKVDAEAELIQLPVNISRLEQSVSIEDDDMSRVDDVAQLRAKRRKIAQLRERPRTITRDIQHRLDMMSQLNVFGSAATLAIANNIVNDRVALAIDADRCRVCNTILLFDAVPSLLVCTNCCTATQTLFLVDDSAVDVLLSRTVVSAQDTATAMTNRSRARSTSRRTATPQAINTRVEVFVAYISQFAQTARSADSDREMRNTLNGLYSVFGHIHTHVKSARATRVVQILKTSTSGGNNNNNSTDNIRRGHVITMLYNRTTPPSFTQEIINDLTLRYRLLLQASHHINVKLPPVDTICWQLLRQSGQHRHAEVFELHKTRTVLRSTHQKYLQIVQAARELDSTVEWAPWRLA